MSIVYTKWSPGPKKCWSCWGQVSYNVADIQYREDEDSDPLFIVCPDCKVRVEIPRFEVPPFVYEAAKNKYTKVP